MPAGAAAAIGGGLGLLGAAKAASAGKVKAKQINIEELNKQASDLAGVNARSSIKLENELTPEVSQLRTDSIKRLLGDLGGEDSYTDQLRGRYNALLNGEGGGDIDLLRLANNRAKEDLLLGGAIPLDVRNQVARVSAANAAGSMGGGLGLGRDLAARDLGLTSLQLRDSRLNNALNAGQSYFNAGQAQQANQYNALTGLQNLSNTGFSRRAALASMGQAIERPQVGLSQGSIADIAIGNNNAANAAAQQSAAAKAQMWNSIGGLGGAIMGGGLGMMANQVSPMSFSRTSVSPINTTWQTSALGNTNYMTPPVSGFNSSFYKTP